MTTPATITPRFAHVLRAMPFTSSAAVAEQLGITKSELSNVITRCVENGWASTRRTQLEDGTPTRYCVCRTTLPNLPPPAPPPLTDEQRARIALRKECTRVLTAAGVLHLRGENRAIYTRVLAAIAAAPNALVSTKTVAQDLGLKPEALSRYLWRASQDGLAVCISPPGQRTRFAYQITEQGRHVLKAARVLVSLL